MKILMISAEAVPFAKTGGLADAVSAFAIALTKAGHDVKIVIPRYYKIDRAKLTKLEGPMAVKASNTETWTAVYTCQTAQSFQFISLTMNSALAEMQSMVQRLNQTSMTTHIVFLFFVTELSSCAAS